MTIEEIENRIRRSSQQGRPDIFREFLQYATVVRDEEEVYAFMEQNKIGIYEPEYWLAKLSMYDKRCQYEEFSKTLKEIRQNNELKSHKYYCLVREIEQSVTKKLKTCFQKKLKKRKTANQYQKLTFSNIQKETRKFGNIQIYIDPQNRHHFNLQNYIDFLMNDDEFKGEFQMNRNLYLRQQQSKPLSYIRKKYQCQFSNTIQVNNGPRKSERRSLATHLRTSDMNKKFETPDFKNKRRQHQAVDSVQILNKRPLRNSRRSFLLQKSNPEIEISEFRSSYCEKQRPRSIIEISAKRRNKTESFSFGKRSFSLSLLQISSQEEVKDEAFIVQIKDSSKKSQDQNLKLSEELNQLIHNHQPPQTFTQGTFTQTVSQIDSNQENNYFLDEKELNYQDELDERLRNKLKTKHKEKRNKDGEYRCNSFNDIDEDFPQLFTPKTYERVENVNSKNLQSENKSKRFSRISQEKSYSFSESKSCFKL